MNHYDLPSTLNHSARLQRAILQIKTPRLDRLGWLALLLSCSLLSACMHTTSPLSQTVVEDDWKYQFIHYRSSLPDNVIHESQQLLNISDEMRQDVLNRFAGLSKTEAAKALAAWIVAEDGLNLEFVFDANFTPIQVYQRRQANCLTYSILLRQLASVLDIDIQINSVDTPDTWSMEDDTLFFYRHVNGMYKTPRQNQAFDFTPASYDPRYPQRTITQQEALALFYNNRALDHYRNGDNQAALQLIKMATSLSADNPDIWANVGTILKAGNERQKAKQALEFSLQIDKHHLVAVSQLERLYRDDGDLEQADRYAAQANRTRTNNPYFLYRKSKQGFLDQDYKLAKELVTKAIGRHRYDPRFFALLGVIESKTENYKAAQRSFKKASNLAKDSQQKQSYASKAKILGRAYRAQNQNNDGQRPWVDEGAFSPSILR